MASNVVAIGDDADVKRDKHVMIRLTSEEHRAWTEAAEADQRKLADWIRIVVNAHTSPVKPKRKRQP